MNSPIDDSEEIASFFDDVVRHYDPSPKYVHLLAGMKEPRRRDQLGVEDRKWKRGGIYYLRARAFAALVILVLIPVGGLIWVEVSGWLGPAENEVQPKPLTPISSWRPGDAIPNVEPVPAGDINATWERLQKEGAVVAHDGANPAGPNDPMLIPFESTVNNTDQASPPTTVGQSEVPKSADSNQVGTGPMSPENGTGVPSQKTSPAGSQPAQSANGQSGDKPSGEVPSKQFASRVLYAPGQGEVVNAIAWSPDSKSLASVGSRPNVRLWDTETGKSQVSFDGPEGQFYCVAWSADGKTLVYAGADEEFKYPCVRLLDVTTKQRTVLKGHSNLITSVAWSPDGKTLASGSRDDTVRLWDLASGNEVRIFRQKSVAGVAWSPDRKDLASAGGDAKVILWDLSTGKSRQTFSHDTKELLCITYSPDGKELISGGVDKTMRVWDLATGKERISFNVKRPVVSVAWNPDGSTLATADGTSDVTLWDAATRKEIAVLAGHEIVVQRVAWSPDGKTLAASLASVNRHGVKLWNINLNNQ